MLKRYIINTEILLKMINLHRVSSFTSSEKAGKKQRHQRARRKRKKTKSRKGMMDVTHSTGGQVFLLNPLTQIPH